MSHRLRLSTTSATPVEQGASDAPTASASFVDSPKAWA